MSGIGSAERPGRADPRNCFKFSAGAAERELWRAGRLGGVGHDTGSTDSFGSHLRPDSEFISRAVRWPKESPTTAGLFSPVVGSDGSGSLFACYFQLPCICTSRSRLRSRPISSLW